MVEERTIADLPAIRRASIWERLTRAIGYVLDPSAEAFEAGADFTPASPAAPGYDPRAAMSTVAAFPWVRACVSAIADDLAGLDWYVYGPDGERVEGHPLEALLRAPSSRVTGRAFMAQVATDLTLTGNAYAVLLDAARLTRSLLRMHPARVEARPRPDGQIDGYLYDGRVSYAWDDVLHVRGPSWADTPEGVLGESPIRALHEDLSAELASKRQAARAARRGRYDVLIRPGDRDTVWNAETLREVRNGYDAGSERGGALVVGSVAEVTPLSLSARDMEFSAMATATRDAVLAVFGVPPSRVGLPTANYATQAQQMRTYWEGLRGGPVSAIEDGLSWLASRLSGRAGEYVQADLSGVESLQESYSERLQRVTTHVLLGMPVAAAYRLEGLDAAAAAIEDAPPPPPVAPADPAPERMTRAVDVTTASARADYWRAWERGRLTEERAIAVAASAFLRGQADRIASRAAEVLGERGALDVQARALSETDIEKIVSAVEEIAAMRRAMRPTVGAAVGRSAASVFRLLGLRASALDPTRDPVGRLIDALCADVTATTAEAVRQLVERSIASGQSIAQLQEQLRASAAFSPARALRIGRTESTRALGAGAEAAYEQVQADGLDLEQVWVSARDGEVRDSHRALDGQVVGVGEAFTDPSTGDTARYPGGFSIAAQDINCRCTTVPRVRGDA